MANALDTHAYDAKWKEELQNINTLDDQFFQNITDFPKLELIDLCTSDPGIKQLARNWHAQITVGGGGNIDPANGVDASDILHRVERIIQYRLYMAERVAICDVEEVDRVCALYHIAKSGDPGDPPEELMVVDLCDVEQKVHGFNTSIINGYVEQLADVQNGSCPQGRTTRLFQIYSSFYLC
jgi:hypothetical protein